MVTACYFGSILTKLVFPRQSSLSVPTNDITKIRPVGVDGQTERLAQGSYILVAFRNFYNSSKMSFTFSYLMGPNREHPKM